MRENEVKKVVQLGLPLEHFSYMRRADFAVGSANEHVVSIVDHWGTEGFVFTRGAVIVGEKDSGKTHLCSAWGEKMGNVHYMTGDGLGALSVSDVQEIDRPVVIDSQKLWRDEEHFLHQYNVLIENGIDLLMTSRRLPSAWEISLPDLKSRMMGLGVGVIGTPDDKLMKSLLRKHLRERGIGIPTKLEAYILCRLGRDFSEVVRLSEYVDQLSLEQGKLPGLKIVKEAMLKMKG